MPDYAGGAMENWGLITFRESYLLADPRTASLQEQLGVASIVAHEMAHMASFGLSKAKIYLAGSLSAHVGRFAGHGDAMPNSLSSG